MNNICLSKTQLQSRNLIALPAFDAPVKLLHEKLLDEILSAIDSARSQK